MPVGASGPATGAAVGRMAAVVAAVTAARGCAARMAAASRTPARACLATRAASASTVVVGRCPRARPARTETCAPCWMSARKAAARASRATATTACRAPRTSAIPRRAAASRSRARSVNAATAAWTARGRCSIHRIPRTLTPTPACHQTAACADPPAAVTTAAAAVDCRRARRPAVRPLGPGCCSRGPGVALAGAANAASPRTAPIPTPSHNCSTRQRFRLGREYTPYALHPPEALRSRSLCTIFARLGEYPG